MDHERYLPDVITGHIQSFLNRKLAARTSVLSKAWHSAWSNRLVLDFDEPDDLQTMLTTIQRYGELYLKIEDLSLRIYKVTDSDSISLANELINKAMELGVSQFSLESSGKDAKYVLPVRVLESKYLVNLFISGCRIDQQFGGDMICSNIESICLNKVYINNKMVKDIILWCPLLETLYLFECDGLSGVSLGKLHKLKKFSVMKCGYCNLFCLSPEYGKLKCLMLEGVNIDNFFFYYLSFMFPCLEKLCVLDCVGYEYIDISSHSLKDICVRNTRMLKKAKFAVPSIREFKLVANYIPSLSFVTSSKEYKSHILFTFTWTFTFRGRYLRDSMLLDLKKLLTELSQSKISLSINIHSLDLYRYVREFRSPSIPSVENLMLKIHRSAWLHPGILGSVFWSCHPKFLTVYDDYDDDDDDDDVDNDDDGDDKYGVKYDDYYKRNKLQRRALLWKFLVQKGGKDCFRSTQKFSYMNDLKKANVEFFDKTLEEWQPVPWKFYVDSKVQVNNKRFRFRLKWRAWYSGY